MFAYRRAPATPFSTAQHCILAVLAAALLAAGFSGRAGVQVLDRALQARLFPLHLHGVPGEAAYVHEHHETAPFVPPHCHAPLKDTPARPGPDDVQAASALGGVVLCTPPIAAPASPSALRPTSLIELPVPAGIAVPVLEQPPR